MAQVLFYGNFKHLFHTIRNDANNGTQLKQTCIIPLFLALAFLNTVTMNMLGGNTMAVVTIEMNS